MAAVAPLRAWADRYWVRTAVVIVAVAGLTTMLFGRGSVLVNLVHGAVFSACIGTLSGLILPVVCHRVKATGPMRQWAAILGAIFVVAVAGTFAGCVILGGLGMSFGRPLTQRFAGAFQLNALLTAVIGVAMTLYESQRARLDALTLELRTTELEHERARKAALEARLASLESRLHPHFLFNTLNAISELIHENPDRAERTVERLAVLLRAALDASERGSLPLGRELELVSDYLEIEKARLGDRLTYALAASPEAASCEIPPLAVQTLVENSVKHAVAPRPTGGAIRVHATARDGRLVVGVWDDGPGFALDDAPAGHGLETLRSRLAARFGAAAELTVQPHDGGTLVTLAIPRAGPGHG